MTHTVALAALIAAVPGSYLWWSLYGLGAVVNVLAFAVLNVGFAKELAARANTALNLLMFCGSFLTQWGIGVIAETATVFGGADAGEALKIAFVVVLALDTLALLWFAWGWRRHATPVAANAPA
jgi:hypothetical protein